MTYVHDWDRLLAGVTKIFDHVLDQHGTLGDAALWENVSINHLAQSSNEQ